MRAEAIANAIETQTIFTLPSTVGVVAVQQACRSALLAFVNEAEAWTKRDVALWLAKQYAPICRASRGIVARVTVRKRTGGTVDTQKLITLVEEAVIAVREILAASLIPQEGNALAAEIWAKGHVVRCADQYGNEGWVPVDLPGMRLIERIASLWAADYLTNASEYQQQLSMCRVCNCASFESISRVRGTCSKHQPAAIRVHWFGPEESVYSSHLRVQYPDNDVPSGIHRRPR